MALEIATVCGGPLSVNTYVVSSSGADVCALIDPGAQEDAVRDAVGARRVEAVLLTHAHFDHMMNAQPWLDRGAKLYVHALDEPALSDPELNLSTMIGASLRLPPPDMRVADGGTMTAAGLTFSVLHTPGHTPGSVCYLCDGALFSGDTLFYHSYGRVDLPGGDAEQMRASLARVLALGEATPVYPGHGLRTKIGWERGMRL